MFANVLPQITGNIPLIQKDVEFLNMLSKDKLADFIPYILETAQVDLIGSDYFWDIISSDIR